jgi:RND family efflux transporter MFP subunit
MKFHKSLVKKSVSFLMLITVGFFVFKLLGSSEPERNFIYATKGDIRDVITAKGTVGYRHQVSLRAGVAGRLERMPLQEGAAVRNDQLLFRIVDPQAKTEQLSRVTTQERHALHIEHLQRDVSDLKKLVAAGATARQELEARQTELELSLKDQELARLDRKRLESTQERAWVKSPFDGVIVSLIAANGQWVNLGDELAVIAGGSRLQIVAQIEAAEVTRLAVNQAVDFSDQPDGGQFRRGHVVAIGEVAQGAQQAGTVRVTVEPDGEFEGFRIGQSIYLEFVLHEAKNVLRLPRGYVRVSNGRTTVLVLDGKRVIEREVRIAGGDRQVDQIADGLTTADRVVRGLPSTTDKP